MTKKIVFIVNDMKFFISHRVEIAKFVHSKGYRVILICPDLEGSHFILPEFLEHYPLYMDRRSVNFFTEFGTIFHLFYLLARIRPNLVHAITAKPIFYSGICARLLGLPCVAAISGMGSLFTGGSKSPFLGKMALLLYRFSLNRSKTHIIFQNESDYDFLIHYQKIAKPTASIIPGSGTDLGRFRYVEPEEGRVIVLLPARMIREKGVYEFVEAARMIKETGVAAEFILSGDPDPGNPNSISVEELSRWNDSDVVRWQGHTNNIESLLSKAHIVALPSYYREGFPKSLIDAAACGRAIVTTDMVGCRDAIVDGVTGLLCKPKDAKDLADKLLLLLRNRGKMLEMGRAGRRHAEENFDVMQVCRQHSEIYENLLRNEP